VYVCVCVCERERELERERKKKSACVCVLERKTSERINFSQRPSRVNEFHLTSIPNDSDDEVVNRKRHKRSFFLPSSTKSN